MEKSKLTRREAKAWQARWKRFNEFQIREIRKMPRKLKLQQANLLFRLARSLNLRHDENDPEIAELRKRWAKVKRRYEKNARRA